MSSYMLTTVDNPYSPFTQFDEWYGYDLSQGYDTCGYLARVAYTSENLSESNESYAIDQAMDEIIELNPLGIYKKVTKFDYE